MNLDVLVIGAGTAGKYAAEAAKKNNVSVGIAEKEKVGGDCIFHACIPTKALVHAARTYKKIKRANYFGLPVFKDKANYKFVKAFKDSLVSDISKGLDDELIKEGITLFRGDAKFISPNEVVVGNDVIKAKNIIIATGSIPSIPSIPGLKETGYITNIEALELEKIPSRLAIIGGGAVGVEFAQIFSSFGAKVHIYETLERILFNEDEEISTTLFELFSQNGISVFTSVQIDEVLPTANGKLIISNGSNGENKSHEYDEILIATGRKPAIDTLNLPAARVEFNNKGIFVDNSLRTNVPYIWAAGDVTGLYLFTFIAWEQGEVAGYNAISSTQLKKLHYDILPKATFCDPEVASVGLTEAQAHEKGYKVKVGKFDYSNLSRIMVSGDTEGFIKIIADEDSGHILGGHILGLEASNLIHEIALAMKKLTVKDVGDTFHAYPTISEGIRYACQSIS